MRTGSTLVGTTLAILWSTIAFAQSGETKTGAADAGAEQPGVPAQVESPSAPPAPAAGAPNAATSPNENDAGAAPPVASPLPAPLPSTAPDATGAPAPGWQPSPAPPSAPTPAEGATPEDPRAIPTDLPRLILDSGRPVPRLPEPDLIRFQLHGEYQLRYQRQSNILLEPTASRIDQVPGLTQDSIGQTENVHHWLRLTPSLQLGQAVEVVGQIDLVTGMVAGSRARGTSADEDPRDDLNGFKNVQPRWLYATFRTDIGVFRVGQQPAHWGMGVFVNDGDHPNVFGDYRYGSIYERAAFVTKPFGKKSPLVVGVTGDLVYRDANATLTDGDKAFQAGLVALLEKDENNQIGLFGLWRSQRRDKSSGSDLFSYTEGLDVGVVDVSGKFAVPAPGANDLFLYGAAEVAAIFGKTNLLRQTQNGVIEDSAVRSWGGAARIGVVHRSRRRSSLDREDITTHGDFVGQLEAGYASGDADPYDNVQRRFTFANNYKVGLLLFDEVLRWQTARAATAAQDPLLTNANRPTPGVDKLPSNGAIFGAQYLYPTFIARPWQWLDLKLGAVIAQTTADLVDPYRVVVNGNYENYRGGSPRNHDLGVELDTGVEGRVPLNSGLVLNVGVQGGVLFPGAALADAGGATLSTPWIWVGRFGLTF